MKQAAQVYLCKRKRSGRRGGFYYVLRWHGPAPRNIVNAGKTVRERGALGWNYERLSAETREAATKYARAKQRELEDGIFGVTEAVPWSDFQSRYVEALRNLKYRHNHLVTVGGRLRMFAERMGIDNIKSVDNGTVTGYRDRRQAETHNGRPLSAHTVNNNLATIHAAFAWGVAEGLLSENPADKVAWVAADRPRANPMKRQEATALIDAAERYGGRWLLFVYLALTTGMRKMKLCELEWSDTDLDDAKLALFPSETKTRVARDLPLDPYAIDLLSQTPRQERTGPVFKRRNGSAWTANINDTFRRIIADAGLVHLEDNPKRGWRKGKPRFTIHDLRATFNSLAKECGAMSEVVQAIMGHAPRGVNQRHYTDYTMEALRNAQRVLPYLRLVA